MIAVQLLIILKTLNILRAFLAFRCLLHKKPSTRLDAFLHPSVLFKNLVQGVYSAIHTYSTQSLSAKLISKEADGTVAGFIEFLNLGSLYRFVHCEDLSALLTHAGDIQQFIHVR